MLKVGFTGQKIFRPFHTTEQECRGNVEEHFETLTANMRT